MTDSEKIILKFIAENGPASAYYVTKQTELIKQTARAALKRLYEKELLSQHEEPAEKSPHPKKVYSLTVLGILKAVGKYDVNIEGLAKTHGEVLPLILGKYTFYKQRDLEKVIPLILRKVFKTDLDAVEGEEPEKRPEAVEILFYYRLLRDLAIRGDRRPLTPVFDKRNDIRGLYDKNKEEVLDLLMDDKDIRSRIAEEIIRQLALMEHGWGELWSFTKEKLNKVDPKLLDSIRGDL